MAAVTVIKLFNLLSAPVEKKVLQWRSHWYWEQEWCVPNCRGFSMPALARMSWRFAYLLKASRIIARQILSYLSNNAGFRLLPGHKALTCHLTLLLAPPYSFAFSWQLSWSWSQEVLHNNTKCPKSHHSELLPPLNLTTKHDDKQRCSSQWEDGEETPKHPPKWNLNQKL